MSLYVRHLLSVICLGVLSHAVGYSQNKIIVFQSDFGLKDGAVSAMKGVAQGVSWNLKLYDLTHEIPSYNIWEASYRLLQTMPYWEKGTVFVSVVDPGVGTNRKSVVLKTKTGQYVVTPDNGTLTLVAEAFGIEEIREIDEAINRRKNSEASYTFHGRDVYAYTAARLAASVIAFEQVGKTLPKSVVTIPYQKGTLEQGILQGTIPILDVQYGNIWTNIDGSLIREMQLKYGDVLHVVIYHQNKKVYEGDAPYSATFGAVPTGKPLCYLNSLLQLSIALNQGNFASTYHIASGNDWQIKLYPKHP